MVRSGLDLLTQPPHLHRDRGRISMRPPPHGFEQLLAAEHVVRMAQEEHQQGVFPASQRHELAAHADVGAARVDDEVAVAQQRATGVAVFGRLGPPQDRAHPRRTSSRRLNGFVR